MRRSLEAGEYGSDGLGQQLTQTMRGNGVAVMPDRSRLSLDSGDAAYEFVVVPEGHYERERGAPDERWTFWESAVAGHASADPGPAAAAGDVLGLGGSAQALGVFEPDVLPRVLERIRDPQRLSGSVISADLALLDLFDPAALEELVEGSVRVELTSDADGRLDRARWTVLVRAHEDPREPKDPFNPVRLRLDVSYSRWDVSVEIAEPDPLQVVDGDAVSPVFDLDGDALRGYDDTALVAPTILPAGYRLTAGGVQDGYYDDEATAPVGCDEAVLVFHDPDAVDEWVDDPDIGPRPAALVLVLAPAACPEDPASDSAGERYTAGPFEGEIWRPQPDYYGPEDTNTSAELIVGTTRVHASTQLSEADLTEMLASLAPFDLDKALAQAEATLQ